MMVTLLGIADYLHMDRDHARTIQCMDASLSRVGNPYSDMENISGMMTDDPYTKCCPSEDCDHPINGDCQSNV